VIQYKSTGKKDSKPSCWMGFSFNDVITSQCLRSYGWWTGCFSGACIVGHRYLEWVVSCFFQLLRLNVGIAPWNTSGTLPYRSLRTYNSL